MGRVVGRLGFVILEADWFPAGEVKLLRPLGIPGLGRSDRWVVRLAVIGSLWRVDRRLSRLVTRLLTELDRRTWDLVVAGQFEGGLLEAAKGLDGTTGAAAVLSPRRFAAAGAPEESVRADLGHHQYHQ